MSSALSVVKLYSPLQVLSPATKFLQFAMGFSKATNIVIGVLLTPLVCLTLFFLVLNNSTGLEWIFSDSAVISSYRFSSLFLNSYFIVITILILLSISILYKPIKESNKTLILKRFILCIVIFVVTLIPFGKGYDINILEELGYKLIQDIDNFHIKNDRYPAELSELGNLLTLEENEIAISNFNYYISESSGNYVLVFVPNNNGMMAFYYNNIENKFIGTD